MTKSTQHCSRKYLDLLKILVPSLEDLHPQVRKLQSHLHVRPPHVSNLLSKPPNNLLSSQSSTAGSFWKWPPQGSDCSHFLGQWFQSTISHCFFKNLDKQALDKWSDHHELYAILYSGNIWRQHGIPYNHNLHAIKINMRARPPVV